jgi:hypothetical protein
VENREIARIKIGLFPAPVCNQFLDKKQVQTAVKNARLLTILYALRLGKKCNHGNTFINKAKNNMVLFD